MMKRPVPNMPCFRKDALCASYAVFCYRKNGIGNLYRRDLIYVDL